MRKTIGLIVFIVVAFVLTLVLTCAGIVGGVSEEVGLRGYLLGALQRRMPRAAAVVVAALIAAPGHALTQGFVWPTLLFYLLADLTYGATAALTDSILPGLIAHAAGLTTFFAFIWPHDAARPAYSSGEPWFWIHAGQAVGCGVLAIGAFAMLAKLARADAAQPLNSGSDNPATPGSKASSEPAHG
jgi:membrane protease YdiL (CAAX protease family)